MAVNNVTAKSLQHSIGFFSRFVNSSKT